MSERVFYNRRDWLNPKGYWDSGAMSSKVSSDKGGLDCNISIWDCGRKISLDLGVYTEAQGRQRCKKIQVMIDHLQGVQRALGPAYEHFKAEQAEQDE